MHKARRASANDSFSSLPESASPPSGSQLEFLHGVGHELLDSEDVLASPGPTTQRAAPPGAAAARLHVEPAQRRSTFLAEGMLAEHVACDRVGRDRDGCEVYVMRLVESHGFRWNRFLHRLASTDMPRARQLEYVDADSDCSTTDDEENDIVAREGELL